MASQLCYTCPRCGATFTPGRNPDQSRLPLPPKLRCPCCGTGGQWRTENREINQPADGVRLVHYASLARPKSSLLGIASRRWPRWAVTIGLGLMAIGVVWYLLEALAHEPLAWPPSKFLLEYSGGDQRRAMVLTAIGLALCLGAAAFAVVNQSVDRQTGLGPGTDPPRPAE